MDELRAALELATEDELQELTEVLFQRRFNPLDYLTAPEPLAVQSQDRDRWIDDLESRFRFLAADGFTVLQGRADRLSYREILLGVCQHLKIPYGDRWTVADLEAEIFLHLLERAWKRLSKAERQTLTAGVRKSLARSRRADSLPEALRRDPVRLALEGGGALALSAVVRPVLLRHLAQQFALHFARYQAARAAIAQGSAAAAALQGPLAAQVAARATEQMARRGMALTVARYGAARATLAVLGPALWAWFFADLGWRTIATNYSRILPAIFAVAQIRLTRGADEWCCQPA